MAFEKYLRELAKHEDGKTLELQPGPRERILVNAGVRLNWIGDFLANPKIKFKKISIPVEKIYFTGTTLGWNKILLQRCQKSVAKFVALTKQDPVLRRKFMEEASFGTQPILVRRAEEAGRWKVVDGMHRFVGAVLKSRKTIAAFVPLNEDKHLPVCEPHAVYDLIRGYQRNARDKRGADDLYHGLKLLARCYANVPALLKRRFGFKHVPDKKVQAIIGKVLRSRR